MNSTIQQEFYYDHSIDIVWEYLTTSELMAQWIMRNDFQPEIGREFHFFMKPMPALDLDGTVYCKVLELVPKKKLAYSWKAGPGNDVFVLDSVVTWSLTKKGTGTEVSLVHTGFTDKTPDLYKGMTDGWKGIMAKIGKLINDAKDAAAKG